MTGQSKYMDAYFEEAETKQSREKALDILKRYFDGTETQTARIKEESIFKDADQALYYVKEYGRKGCSFYE